MSTQSIARSVSLIPRERLINGMRANEPALVSECHGSETALLAAYRQVVAAILSERPRLIRYSEMPSHRHLTPRQFATLRKRVEAMLSEAAAFYADYDGVIKVARSKSLHISPRPV